MKQFFFFDHAFVPQMTGAVLLFLVWLLEPRFDSSCHVPREELSHSDYAIGYRRPDSASRYELLQLELPYGAISLRRRCHHLRFYLQKTS